MLMVAAAGPAGPEVSFAPAVSAGPMGPVEALLIGNSKISSAPIDCLIKQLLMSDLYNLKS